MIFRNIKNRLEFFNRYRQILGVLFKYGFGQIVEKLNLEYYFEYGQKIFTRKSVDQEKKDKIQLRGPERLRLAFEELGPTFIKFGQIMSTRPDMLPLDYVNELKKLQDDVEPTSFIEINEIIERSFFGRQYEYFKYIQEESLGSASIGQVHKAAFKDGREVVLKIKKPDIDHIVEIDIAILYDIARLLEKKVPEVAYYNPIKMVNEFSKTIKKELDFTREAKNNEIVRRNFKNYSDFRVPEIYWDFTNENIITMEYIRGRKLQELLNDERILNGENLSNLIANIFIKQILEDGFFHADPHPGNIFIENGHNVVFIDYGMVGVLDDKSQENMAIIFLGIVLKDVDKILEGFKEFEAFPDQVDERTLKAEMRDILQKYYDVSIKNVNVGKLLEELYELVIRHKILIPQDFFLIGKTLMVIDGIARKLNPEFNMIEVSKPFVNKLLFRKYSPKRVLEYLVFNYNNYSKFLQRVPVDYISIIDKFKNNKFGFEIFSKDVREFSRTIDRVVNKLSASIVIAGLTVGSAMLIQAEIGILYRGYSMLGLTGFIIAALFGIFLIYDILRK